MRDAFAVLFFVSVGMLFDPMIMIREWGPVLATFAIILIGKSVAAYAIVRMFPYSHSTPGADHPGQPGPDRRSPRSSWRGWASPSD